MGVAIVNGASCMCSFGTAPGTLTVTSQTKVLCGGQPQATIQDTTLTPFGLCSSMANPAVASATAAALGVLTPQPCTCMPAGAWIPTKPTVLADGKPVLTNDAKLICSLGVGTISVTVPGQTKIIVP